jgi:hypothetical protein
VIHADTTSGHRHSSPCRLGTGPIQDRVESGTATEDQYLRAFAGARAAAALDQAFGVDSLDAAFAAVYEASHAVENLDALIGAVMSAS